MKKLLTVLLALMTITASASAETIRTYSVSWTEEAQALLADKYPDLQVERWMWDEATHYLTTAEFAAPLQTRSFDWDVFGISGYSVDARLLMEKGYLLDLSGSEQVRAYISRLHPTIAAQCMRDDGIYALPSVYKEPTGLLYVDMDNWLAAGYGPEDIPSTFPAYLDFVEGYIERCEQEPDLEYVIGGFDKEDYNEGSWPGYFAIQFIQNHIYQCQFAGESLRFNDEAVVEIIERCEALGKRLYRLQPRGITESYNPPSLFGLFPGWSHLAETRVDLRLSEDQPRLTPISISFTVVNAATNQPELATDFAAALFQAEPNLLPEYNAILFQDAEPVRNPDFETLYHHMLNMVALAEHRLARDETPLSEYMIDYGGFDYAPIERRFRDKDDWEVREELERWQRSAELQAEREWLFSAEDLAAYQACVDELYFVKPSIFNTTQESGDNYTALLRQFCDGRLSAREFCEQLDRVAWMMQLENP